MATFKFASNIQPDPAGEDDVITVATLADGTALPSWMSFNSSTGIFTATPSNSDAGTYSFKVSQSVGGVFAASSTFDAVITASTGVAPNISTVTINNTAPKVGDTLTATVNYTTPGNPAPTVVYQWKSGGVDVGTNSLQYTAVDGDLGDAISVEVDATNATGTDNAVSADTAPVAAASSDIPWDYEMISPRINVGTNDSTTILAAAGAAITANTAVETLVDRTGNVSRTTSAPLNHTQTNVSRQPTYAASGIDPSPNGHYPIVFSGSDKSLASPAGSFTSNASKHTIVMLARVVGQATTGGANLIGVSGATSFMLRSSSAATAGELNGNGGVSYETVTSTTPRWRFIVHQRTATTTTAGGTRGYLNGSATPIVGNATITNVSNVGLVLFNGGNGTNTGADALGHFFHYIAVEGDLSSANLDRIIGKMAHDYGVADDDDILDADHPYKVSPPTVAAGTTSTL